MSTRSNIIIKVKPEDIGKTISFDKKKLPHPVELSDWDEGQKSDEFSEPVKIEKDYLCIYCHWDGYPSGIGAALLENFNDYDSVLNLIAGGSCSYVETKSVKHYANRLGEEWKYLKPKQANQPEPYSCWTEYAYIFEDGKWFVGVVKTLKDKKSEGIYNIVELTDNM